MSTVDSIAVLEDVLRDAKLARKWSQMLVSARSISENDTATLERVLRERREIVELLGGGRAYVL